MSANTPLVPFADLTVGTAVTATTADGSVALEAARCSACGTAWFPRGAVCPSCAAPDPDRRLIGPYGRLYSFSTVHVSASRETPYMLGYIDMDEGVRVLATIDASVGAPEVDARCRLLVGDDGRWWFTPEADHHG